ncbi:MAG: Histidine kinase, gyrase and HSP90-like ATPase, partial [Pseudonocardiales bacterium]|nr:Histidine kinase, gyrase and HSP90-like ATPase [Pseudonocardiales bacterium]
MPSDYELIRKENMREYGEGTRHLDFLQQLYADRTHFIYELLQNAEDARASRIAFTVHHDRLVVHHDGRPFNEQDVRGICGVNASTKEGDLTRIGKFGIGFKSVYAYTLAPEVHSGTEHFRIQHYVRPEAVGHLAGSDAALTTFVFPFDRRDVPVEVAHREISSGLHALNPETLLFLRNLERVTVHAGSGTIVLSRRQAQDDVRNVELVVSQNDRVISHQYWQVFRRDLERVGYPGQRVEIAFKRAGAAHEAPVERVPRAPLVVYFPTDKPTGLGFLLQAPLRTTPARDNVAEYDPDNAKLVAEAAQLLLDALEEMRHEGRLGLDVFQVLPIVPEEFPEGSLLRPLFDALRDAVRTQPLLPVAGTMRHAPAANVRLARVAGLRELLTAEQLGALAGTAGALQWQHERLTRDRTPTLWDYLRHVIGVDEVTPEWVVLQLTQGFLEKANDSWLIRLYN